MKQKLFYVEWLMKMNNVVRPSFGVSNVLNDLQRKVTIIKSLKHAFNSNTEDNNEFYQFFLKEKNTTEIKNNK